MKYYAVAKGRVPQIYTNWQETQNQIKGYSGAAFKSFSTIEEAKEFMKCYGLDQNGKPLTNALTTDQLSSPSFSNSFFTSNPSTTLSGKNLPDYVFYIDGSADNLNKTPRGGAGVVKLDGSEKNVLAELVIPILHYPFCTNNIAELIAMEKALEQIKSLPLQSRIVINGDSLYVLNHMKQQSVKPHQPNYGRVIHLINLFNQVNVTHQIELRHIEAHRGHQWNELADQLANHGRTVELKN